MRLRPRREITPCHASLYAYMPMPTPTLFSPARVPSHETVTRAEDHDDVRRPFICAAMLAPSRTYYESRFSVQPAQNWHAADVTPARETSSPAAIAANAEFMLRHLPRHVAPIGAYFTFSFRLPPMNIISRRASGDAFSPLRHFFRLFACQRFPP